MSSVQTSFDDTCVPVKYRCTIGEKYVDPCNCSLYYQCAREDEIISQPCGPGTGFNYKNNLCSRLSNLVIDGLCNLQEPWNRCFDVKDYEDLSEAKLEQRCTGRAPPDDDDEDDKGVDGGLIAGVVIAVLVVAIIVIALIIYIRKRGNPLRRKDTGGGRPSDTQGAAGAGDEETYAEIADTAVYKDPSGGKNQAYPQLSHTNEAYMSDEVEEVSYDNPALKRADTQLPPPPRQPPALPEEDPPTYSPLEETAPVVVSYSSLYEHNKGDASASADADPTRGSKELPTGDDGYLVAEAIGGTPRNSSPVDPSYFVLEKTS